MIAAVAFMGLVCLATTAQAKPSGSWRITFDSQADVDGVIGLRIEPAEGAPIDVEVKIPARTTENRVADLVSDSLKKALGTKNFRVGVDDGESVVIKKRGKTKNFELSMVTAPIHGLGVKLKSN
jgi:hypothetical protein